MTNEDHKHTHTHADGSVCHHDHGSNGHHHVQQQPMNPMQLQWMMEQMNLVKKHGKQQENYAFWNTQPVPKMDDVIEDCGPIEPDTPHDQIPKSPLTLPAGFEWCELNVDNEQELEELQGFLAENYLEDFQSTFRFTYSKEILKWALTPPGFKKTWHPCVRVSSSKKLVGFISALPCHVAIKQEPKHMVEINFLCVHKKLRSKRLAPVLIREITRRVHLQGLFQAFYTAGVLLPKPISSCQYYHRQINPKKLIETEFSYLKKNMTMARTIKFLKVPDQPQIKGFRSAKPSDLDAIYKLHVEYMKKFDFYPKFTKEEAKHYLMSVENVLHIFVVEDPQTKKITDFVGFFTIDNHVLNHAVHKNIKAAFLWYYAPQSLDKLNALILDAIVAAKNLGHDVLNCMALMDNEQFLQDLKFGPGDASLHFYLYNYRCPTMEGNKQAFLII